MNAQNKEQRVIQALPGYGPAIARWVWAVEDARARTKQCLDGLIDDLLDWRSLEDGTSIGMLLYHIVAIELSYLYEDILQLGWAPELEPLLPYDVRDEHGHLVVVHGESLEQHLQRLDAGRALLLKALRQMSLADFLQARQGEDYDVTPEWVLHHLMQHEAEHRGQMTAIRRRAEHAAS